MPRAALVLALVLVPLALAGCAAKEVKLNGVAPAGDGNLRVDAGPGLTLVASPENHTLALGLAAILQAQAIQVCANACLSGNVTPGTLIVGADAVVLGNMSLGGTHVVAWSDLDQAFQLRGSTVVLGNLTAVADASVPGTGYLGTRTLLAAVVNGQIVRVSIGTAALEGNEVTVFVRGSGQLTNGSATIMLPGAFTQLARADHVTAQVTLTTDGPTLYVAERATDHITVRAASGAPASDATFDWFVQAPRRGSEGFVV